MKKPAFKAGFFLIVVEFSMEDLIFCIYRLFNAIVICL
jgi:hypothetical protein